MRLSSIPANARRAIFTVFIAAATLTTPWGPSAAAVNGEESQRFMLDAQRYLGKGDINAAVIQFKNAIKSDPDNAKARFLLGGLYLRLGQGAGAEKEFRAARKRGFDDGEILVPLARAYLLQAKFQNVLDEFSAAVLTTRTPEMTVMMARAEIGLRRFKEAESLLSPLTGKDDKYAPAHTVLAQVYVRTGRADAADKEIDAALALTPDSAEALVIKGELLRARRDRAGAIDYFSRALQANPSNVLALLGRAATLIDQNKMDQAGKDLDAADKLAPNNPFATYLRALSLARQQKFEAAKDKLLSAGRALDEHMPSIYLLGALSYALKQYEQAEAYLSRFVAIVPNNLPARQLLAAALMRKGDAREAIRILRPAVDKAPDDARLLALLGAAYMQNRQYADGSDMLERAAAVAPDVANIRTQLALSRLAAGSSDQAVDDLQAALDLDPGSSQAALVLAYVKLRKGDYDGALKAARRLGKQQPGNPLPSNLAGAAYLGKGDVAAAKKQFEEALRVAPGYFPAQRNLAEIDFREGHPDKARARLEALIGDGAKGAKSIRPMTALAELALRQNRIDDAIAWLEKATRADPAAAVPRARLANLYMRAREPEKALSTARELERRYPDNPRAIDTLGRAQMAAGETGDAVATFERLTARLPDAMAPLLQLAQAQVAAKNPAGARETLRKAMEKGPEDVRPYVVLANLETGEGRYDEARRAARYVVKKKPDAALGFMLLGNVEMAARNYSEAATAFGEAYKRQPSSVSAVRLFQSRIGAGRQEEAIAGMREWVAANPDDRQSRLILGNGYLSLKRYDEAIDEFERLARDIPDSAVVLNNLAWLYQQKGDPRAVATAEKAMGLAPNSPQVVDTYGWILVQNGDVEKGIKLLRTASIKAPQQLEIRYHLAVGLYKSGRTDEARRMLETLLSMGGDFKGLADARALLRKLPK